VRAWHESVTALQREGRALPAFESEATVVFVPPSSLLDDTFAHLKASGFREL